MITERKIELRPGIDFVSNTKGNVTILYPAEGRKTICGMIDPAGDIMDVKITCYETLHDPNNSSQTYTVTYPHNYTPVLKKSHTVKKEITL